MLPLRLYYFLKPSLPWGLRIGLRRVLARQIRRRTAATWPILEAAGRKINGWPGWPEGKQFAFVLTHDVEGPTGLAGVRPLMELEMRLGYRSSFNFIPEGPYQVPRELRADLAAQGFEVGIHDLHHDGTLFESRASFPDKARRINQYLKEWNAVGFRSGFMFHELDWFHELRVAYDASTFDTDPFEPQPDGVGTIFPFWVPAPGAATCAAPAPGHREAGHRPPPAALESSGLASDPPTGGYVELPYTLSQDSTLFLVLQEPDDTIWRRKLDWIVAQGGMALLNLHPDYICFGRKPGPREYPMKIYTDFLEHVDREYGARAWRCLPRDVAQFVWNNRALLPDPRLSRSACACCVHG